MVFLMNLEKQCLAGMEGWGQARSKGLVPSDKYIIQGDMLTLAPTGRVGQEEREGRRKQWPKAGMGWKELGAVRGQPATLEGTES